MQRKQTWRAIRFGVWMTMGGMLFIGGAAHGATTWHVSTNGNDSADGLSWATALATISNGVAQATTPGDTVLVTNGTYQSYATLEITNGITLKSVNGAEVTIVDCGDRAGVRGFDISHADAVLEGLTIRGGNHPTGTFAGGLTMTAGTVRWCRFLDNYSQNYGSVRMDGGLMHHCIVQDGVWNAAGYYGTVTLNNDAVLRNCLVSDNSYRRGGGIYMGGSSRVENCTVVRNNGSEHTGGIYRGGGTVINTIIYFNTDPTVDYDNWRGSSGFYYSCSDPLPPGADNIDGDPLLADIDNRDYRLLPGSPAMGAGTTNLVWLADNPSEVDLDGNPRVADGSIDIGAYQYTVGALDCTFTADPIFGIAPLESQFTSFVGGTNMTGLTYYWDFTGDGTIDSNDPHPSFSFDPGTFTVSLTVSNAVAEGTTYSRTDYVMAYPATLYVSKTGSNTFPHDTWDKAAASVTDAIAAAGDGSLIRVADGTYDQSATIEVLKGVTIRSENGRTQTILEQVSGGRTLYLSHPDALVDGFTIQRTGGTGGVQVHNFGAFHNCDILYAVNQHGYGAGAYMNGGELVNCRIQGGSDRHIGGVNLMNGALADRCVIIGNTNHTYTTSAKVGGISVAAGCTLRNALIAGNHGIGFTGGVIVNGLVENCTIVGNSVNNTNETVAGGVRVNSGGTLRNTIIVDNINELGGAYTNWYRSAGTIEYTATLPSAAAHGDGNLAIANPLFEAPESGDYRLQATSDCIDQGLNDLTWMADAFDLAGNPRIEGTMVDMGAYEYPYPRGTLLMLR